MKTDIRWFVLMALLVITLPAFGYEPIRIEPPPTDVQGRMNELRRRFPEPQNLGEQNGLVLFTAGDEPFTLLRVRGLADRVKITGPRDLIVLMTYLRDSDLRIRYLAAYLLAQRLDVFVNREPPKDAVMNVDSTEHSSMVEQFATKIAESARRD